MNTPSSIPTTQPLQPVRRAIVVGGSSGIGAALVHELVGQGYAVAALARRIDLLQDVCDAANANMPSARALAYEHDVRDTSEVAALFQDIVRDLGGLDLIVYAAGVQPAVASNEYDLEKDTRMVQVNLVGAMAWLNQAAQRFHHARKGHIVGISSVSGDRGRVAFPGYHATKGAFSIYLESLRNRLSRRGVTVATMKPGFVDTRLLANASKTMWVISPEEAAHQIWEAIQARKQTVYIPGRWRWIMLIIRHIPSFIFRRLTI